MINIVTLYTDFKRTVNTWQGGYASPRNFEAWVHSVQIDIQNTLIKEFEKTQVVTDHLKNFLYSVQVPISDFANGGLVKYPKNYRAFSSLRFFYKKDGNGEGCLCSDYTRMNEEGDCVFLTEEEKAKAAEVSELCEKTIDKVDNKRWGSVCDHALLPPSISNPKSTQYYNGFKVVPKTIGVVILDYFIKPERPKIVVRLDGNHNEIFDEANSIHLNWDEGLMPDFMALLKKKYNSFTKNEVGYNEGEQERQISGV